MPESTASNISSDPTDGRKDSDWQSRYSGSAWTQILLELIYLILLLAALSSTLCYVGYAITISDKKSQVVFLGVIGINIHRELIQWLIVTLAGSVGGVIFDLKWLYHSVAKGLWTRDRVLWRILVPVISGVVSVFLAFIIVSGLLPFVKNETFRTTYFGLGFGFMFGYFSDNVIAALQNFAKKYIGTTNTEDGTND